MKNLKDILADVKVKFLILFAGVFLATFLALYLIGFVPSEISSTGGVLSDLKLQTIEGVSERVAPNQSPSQRETGEAPTRLVIPKANIDIVVENPQSTSNAVLNEYLARGAVHYPGSADLGAGNVFIFGHSSTLSVVQNRAYKALNGIEKLEKGDLIYMDSETHRYIYEVASVRLASADEAFVDFSKKENMLTLSTCDIFGKKQNRFVVEAVFARKENL